MEEFILYLVEYNLLILLIYVYLELGVEEHSKNSIFIFLTTKRTCDFCIINSTFYFL